MMVNDFGNRLKTLRGKMSQEEFAKLLDISRGALSFYENGERMPNIEVVFKMCNVFNVSADYLLGTNINANVDFTYLKDLIADINTTEIASHLNNMDEWTAKWRTEAEKALYKISEDYLK